MYKDIDIFDLLTDESKESVMKEIKEAKEQAKKDGLAEGRAKGIAEGKKVTAFDSKYYHIAEDSLYGELAISLEIEKDEVKDYIVDMIGETVSFWCIDYQKKKTKTEHKSKMLHLVSGGVFYLIILVRIVSLSLPQVALIGKI